MGEVLHIFVSLRHRLPMKEVAEIEVLADRGFRGCAHGRPGSKRQVLLMESEVLEEMGLAPGDVKENITARGVRLGELRRGQRLRVGSALFEVTLPCAPCGRMDDIRRGLQEQLRGRRGMLCRVVEGGRVCRGDRIDVLAAVEAVP